MPMIPVDTAVQIMVGPLIDDTDGKTRETGVAYNAAGMDVDLLKSSDTGTPTTTAITLTTGGTNDWIELSGGYYYVELTAAQNNTEGKLKLIGIATGIMHFESIEYDVVPTQVYNSIVAGTDALQVDTIQVGGTTQTAGDLQALITTVDTVVDGIQTDLSNGTDGLGAIKADTAAALADTNELQTDWANGGRLDNILDARAAEATVTALNNISTAQVNAEVVDVLKTDTIAEMSQGAPPLAPTAFQVLNYMYREWIRNKIVVDTNTLDQKQIFADDGSTVLYEKGLSNATNITTIDEATTGA